MAFIIVIEDDTDMAEAVRLILESNEHRILIRDNPASGVEEAEKNKPDLIILDVMFGRNQKTLGFDYAIEIRRNKYISSVPILMITAVNMTYPNFNFSNKTDGEYLPVDGFIEKPVQPGDLIRKVNELLEMKTSPWVSWPEKKV
ncbi:MAG: response regulator [Spirochaetaceae bacterium]|jgi:DNA-binding response OmpR family regulator|nr:response regulator [Spirochaetaceae bacterium]